MILILTGPVRNYKTTTLYRWSQNRIDCGGVLTPDADGLRRLYNVKEKNSIPFQLYEKTSDTNIMIGKFIFSSDAFQQATIWLNEHLADPDLNDIILDEVGPLELKGCGWDSWLRNAMPQLGNKTLILVVRENLLDAVVQYYQFEEVSVVDNNYFSF